MFMMASCEKPLQDTIKVEGVSLNVTSVELTEGDQTTLTATVNPANATNKNVTWTSSDNNVATVANGKVTAVKAGTATITVKTEDEKYQYYTVCGEEAGTILTSQESYIYYFK